MVTRLVVHTLIVAVALWVAEQLVPGVEVRGGVLTLLWVAFLFGLVNAVLGPILHLVSLPFTILTLGLFALVVNALLFLLVGYLADAVGLPFTVDGFAAAFFGAIVVGVVSFVLHVAIPDRIDRR